jgi:signal transduction histidine kinase/CheY-like chemotaxis protein
MTRLQANAALRFQALAPSVALAIGLSLTLGAFLGTRLTVNHTNQLDLEARVAEIERTLDRRVGVYGEVLWGFSSYFAGSTRVTRDEFGAYVEEAAIFSRYPELSAVGFARRVTPDQRADFENQLRAGHAYLGEAAENLAIFPAGDRPVYYAIDYLQPTTNAARAIGFDIFSEPARRAAVQRALATGRPAASGTIQLITHDTPSPGVLLIMPVGDTAGGPPLGVVTLAFDATTSIGALFDDRDLDFEVYDTGKWLSAPRAGAGGDLLYDSGGEDLTLVETNTDQVLVKSIYVAGRRWTLLAAVPPVVGIDAILPGAILLVGSLFSLIGAAATMALARSRDRAVEMSRAATADLRLELANRTRAKDLLTSALDRAQLATRAKSRFLANMSHEIRTPMNSVIGFTGLLLDETAGPINDQQRAFLERIEAGGNHLVELINQILDLSKIESGALEIDLSQFDLVDLVTEAAAAVDGAAKAGVELVVDMPARACIVRSDPLRLKQVLINLIGNALKFTDTGTVSVRLTADDHGNPLRLDVEDTGPGISESDLPTIFEAFTQADTSTTRQHQGSGLGLAISQQLIGLLAGHQISVVSTLGSGSTFTLHFGPDAHVARASDPAPPAVSNAQREPDCVDGGDCPDALTLALIRSPNRDCDLVSSLAADFGFETIDVKGAGNALEALDALKPAVIVLGIPMSEISGWRLLPLMRQNTELFDTPIILMAEEQITSAELDDLAEAGVAIVYRDHDTEDLTEILSRVRRTNQLVAS